MPIRKLHSYRYRLCLHLALQCSLYSALTTEVLSFSIFKVFRHFHYYWPNFFHWLISMPLHVPAKIPWIFLKDTLHRIPA